MAAAAWMNLPRFEPPGAWSLLGFAAPDQEAELAAAAARCGSYFSSVDGRFWLSAGAADVFDICGQLAGGRAGPLSRELAAALASARAARGVPRRPLVMGILNVTPDSFSDGGRWFTPEAAVLHGLRLVEQGADILDVGGESTRPGADPVDEAEELRRVIPLIESLREATDVLISVDTSKSVVAKAAVEAGADWVNDVTGGMGDAKMLATVAALPGVTMVLMHHRRAPAAESYATAYAPGDEPHFTDVVVEVLDWLRTRAQAAVTAGIPPERIWLDPGFGFGKSHADNVGMLHRLGEFLSTGLPILIGTSRKSSVGRMSGVEAVGDRAAGTAATVAWAAAEGAAGVRVHDVGEMARVVRTVHSLRSAN